MAEIAGLKLIVPSSVAGSGVSVSASGKVTFTSTMTININGCFSSTYDNYLMVISGTAASSTSAVYRMRTSGSDDTGNNYVTQTLVANGSTVSGERFTTNRGNIVSMRAVSSIPSGAHFYIYGPHLSQPTATRAITVDAASSALIGDVASTHSLSTSYDSITIVSTDANITGSLTIYGLSQ